MNVEMEGKLPDSKVVDERKEEKKGRMMPVSHRRLCLSTAALALCSLLVLPHGLQFAYFEV